MLVDSANAAYQEVTTPDLGFFSRKKHPKLKSHTGGVLTFHEA
jgi:hypothetical protein